MLSSLLVILAALPALRATQLAGNENYARNARRSLLRSPAKRSTGLSFDAQSITFSVGDKQYLSPTGSAFKSYSVTGEWGLDEYKGQLLPVTVFQVEGEVTCDVLEKKVESYGSVDDVWDQSFMSAVFLSTNSSFHVASDVAGCVKGWGGSLIVKSGQATSDVADIGLAAVDYTFIPQGPYLAKIDDGITLTQVYRNYRDEAQAFTTAVLATTGNTFVDLAVPVLGLNTLSIPVPSRLYTLDLPNARPLEGRRIAVKDLFDLAGLKTGGGNRAYFNTYPAKTESAVAIQRLIDQGAIVVARAKTSQFANGESATADWVDQMCPFNPRGDGYQQPASSSSGPGAAAGAYEWLDHTIGSDTGGSIIDPASVQGVYGLRPTWNAISLKGAIPMQATQDTAGFFARDAVAGAEFAKGWYGDRFGNYSELPSTLILPNSSWTFEDGFLGTEAFNAFREGLISIVKPTSIDGQDFDGFWNSSGTYEQVGGQTPDEYMYSTYANLITYYQWHNFGASWFDDYSSQNDDRTPFVDPSPLIRWGYGKNLSEADFNTSLTQKATWKEFVDTHVFISDNTTCSNAIMVFPYGLGETAYRNIYPPPASVPLGWGYPAQMAGTPQLIVPVGQVPYESTITNHTEYLPLTVTMFAAEGCDYVLWDLAAKLQENGVTSAVAAGRVAYPDKVQ